MPIEYITLLLIALLILALYAVRRWMGSWTGVQGSPHPPPNLPGNRPSIEAGMTGTKMPACSCGYWSWSACPTRQLLTEFMAQPVGKGPAVLES